MDDHFRADLHCHSNCSDGSDDPVILVKKAKELSLQGLSITDHDTMDAYTPELFSIAKTLGIRILPGVEISSELDGIAVHVLGYGFDLLPTSEVIPPFTSFLQKIQQFRIERNRHILKKLAANRIYIDEEELFNLGSKSIGRPHIAFLMVKKGYITSIPEAFAHFLKDGASCFSRGFKFSPQEVIDQIHQNGGKAVLAHPHFYKNRPHLKKILSCHFDGIECYYASLTKELELPWVQLAGKRNWIATGGSDYHGDFKNTPLGASWVNASVFEQLLS